MSHSKKPENQNTEASATELDESELANVDGGASGSFLKLGDIVGKVTVNRRGSDQLKLGRNSKKGDSLPTEDFKLNFEEIKF